MAGKAMYRRIAATYAREGWTWTNRNGKSVEPYVPNAEDIERTVTRLASHLNNGNDVAASGRIVVKAPSEEEASYPGAKTTVMIEMGRI